MWKSPISWIFQNLITSWTNPRFRVDVSETAFWDNKQFFVNEDITVTTSVPTIVYRVVSPINFIVNTQLLIGVDGGVELRTYRATQGSAGGTFDTPVTLNRQNGMTTAPAYTAQVTVDTGGTFTPTEGEKPLTTLPVKTSGATAQSSSVSAGVVSERGLPPGTYYLIFELLSGTSGIAVYNAIIQERP